jgi:hypothetical protein
MPEVAAVARQQQQTHPPHQKQINPRFLKAFIKTNKPPV